MIQEHEPVTHPSEGNERRNEKRLELSLPMMLLDHKVKTKNIGQGGVYFEVMANNIEKYSLGRTIKIEVAADTSTATLPGMVIKLTGIGEIVRTEEINPNRHDTKLGVALKFKEKLKVHLN